MPGRRIWFPLAFVVWHTDFKTAQGHRTPIEVINDVPYVRERPDSPQSDPAVPIAPKATVEAEPLGEVPPPPIPPPDWDTIGPGGGAADGGGGGDAAPSGGDLDDASAKALETKRNLKAGAM